MMHHIGRLVWGFHSPSGLQDGRAISYNPLLFRVLLIPFLDKTITMNLIRPAN
jgi:hypothetical protein